MRTLISVLAVWVWLLRPCVLWAGEFPEFPRRLTALTPVAEEASFRFADPELAMELVASEPDVLSPVAIAWDALGRLFVAEMRDYPSATTSGSIRLLEDRDGNGHYEHSTVFATGLPFPNGVLPWRDGLLVTAAPDIWYLTDTNFDGVADDRRVVLTGFALGNQQLRVNSLTWGWDNWIYGANGRSDGDVRWSREWNPAIPAPVSLRNHDFRFKPDTLQFEPIAGRSQFGLGRDDWGNRFLSWNTTPLRHEVLPERYLVRNSALPSTESVAEILSPSQSDFVFPLAPTPQTFNPESTTHFNALAGLTIYRGNALGAQYQGNAFVGESLCSLVHRRVLQPSGPTFIATRPEQGTEFLASTDAWFHPVNFATGPDGALYVVDFYRLFVEHPDWVPAHLRTKVAWQTGAEHGRIWRIRHKSRSEPKSDTAGPIGQRTFPGTSTSPELVKFLEHPNSWQRDTAQRLLVEKQDRTVVTSLQRMAAGASSPDVARLHALATLDGLKALDQPTLLRALKDPLPQNRQRAVELSESRLSAEPELVAALLPLTNDTDIRVRFQLALTLGELKGDLPIPALVSIMHRDHTNRWIRLAVLSSLSRRAWPFLSALVNDDKRWLEAPTPSRTDLLDQLGRIVATEAEPTQLQSLLALVANDTNQLHNIARMALATGVADGPRQAVDQLMAEIAAVAPTPPRTGLLAEAGTLATTDTARLEYRLLAIRLLGALHTSISSAALPTLMEPQRGPRIRQAAARAVVRSGDAALLQSVFTNWVRYSLRTRREFLSGLVGSTKAAPVLLDSLEQGAVKSVELEPSIRQALLKSSDAKVKARAQALLQASQSPDRTRVVEEFRPALKVAGDKARGGEIFAKSCLACHRLLGEGQEVGPDLSGAANRAPEALLVDILDPSRDITPDFAAYTIVSVEGDQLTGIIGGETPLTVSLRQANQPLEPMLRRRIKEIRAETKSLMPEGLEQGLDLQGLADLLAFLREPDRGLLKR